MEEKLQKIIGIFKYDLFPYRVVQNIKGWEENGDIITDIGIYKQDMLIAVLPAKMKKEVEKYLYDIKTEFGEKSKELKDSLVKDLIKKYPALEIK